jgi:hypothetical protein
VKICTIPPLQIGGVLWCWFLTGFLCTCINWTYIYLHVYRYVCMYILWPLTCSFAKGTFCNEKWCFPYPVVCELVPLYGSDGIWNKYNTIQYNHLSKIHCNTNTSISPSVFSVATFQDMSHPNFWTNFLPPTLITSPNLLYFTTITVLGEHYKSWSSLLPSSLLSPSIFLSIFLLTLMLQLLYGFIKSTVCPCLLFSSKFDTVSYLTLFLTLFEQRWRNSSIIFKRGIFILLKWAYKQIILFNNLPRSTLLARILFSHHTHTVTLIFKST